jgi:hypothetical protein
MKQNKRYRRPNAEALLQQAIDFAEGAVKTNAAWRQVCAALMHGTGTAPIVFGDAPHELRRWSAVQIASLQMELRRFFRTLVSGKIQDDQGALLPAVRLQNVELSPHASLGDQIVLALDGSARDVIWFQVINLLQSIGVRRLQLCPCGRVFARVGRREFCSTRCQKRYYMRKFRQDQEDHHESKTRAR